MRVTNNIKDYIYERLNKKAEESPKFKDASKRMHEIQTEIINALEVIEEEAAVKAKEVYAQHGVQFEETVKLYRGWNNTYYHRVPEYRECEQITRTLREKAKQEATEICFNLELGGTKDQIAEMIDSITFE